jgi:hypothetical protein
MKFKMALPFTAAALALAACGHHGGDANSSDVTVNSDDATLGNVGDDNLSSGDLNSAAPLDNGTDANATDTGASNAQ